MIKVSDNFNLSEFLDKESSTNLERIINIAQFVRTETKLPVTINNWESGGQYQFSGYRPPQCTIGSKTSEHRVFNAIDLKIGKMTGKEMFDWAVKNANKLYELGVRRIEDTSLTPTWLHLDCKEHGKIAINVIDLKKVTQVIYVK